MPDSGSNFKLYQRHADQTYQSILLHGFCCPYKHLVVVVFIDRNVISEQREQEKKKHCCQIAKIQQTHIKVQSHRITNHQAKFKLTQENK